jgi:hypothetical protein
MRSTRSSVIVSKLLYELLQYTGCTMTTAATSRISFATILGLVVMGWRVNAQIFDNLALGIEYPGISDACADALNSTLSGCPSLLASVSIDNPRLSSGQLVDLCTSECQTSLRDVHLIIAKACGQNSDIISYDNVDWPGKWLLIL